MADPAVARSSSPVPPRRTRLDEIRSDLLAGGETRGADERLLLELAAGSAAIALQVEDVTRDVAHALPRAMHDSKLVLALARTLAAVSELGGQLTRRVETTLTTASALRAQRRLRLVGRE